MDRKKLLKRLEEIERRIDAAVIRIEAQRRIILKIPAHRADLAVARQLLQQMEQALAAFRVLRLAVISALDGAE